jgi:hypothetical protein
MTEISAIIRARLDEGRSIADEDVRALLNENKKLRDALVFYSERNSWRHTISLGHPQIDGTTSHAEEDRGKRARAALKGANQ